MNRENDELDGRIVRPQLPQWRCGSQRSMEDVTKDQGALADLIEQSQEEGAPDWMTDMGCADRFVELAGNELRYVKEFLKAGWMGYDGDKGIWRPDDQDKAMRTMRRLASQLLDEAAEAGDRDDENREKLMRGRARRLLSRSGFDAVLDLAARKDDLQKTAGDFDDPERTGLLLNVKNGTLDFSRPDSPLRKHRREDFLTKFVDLEYDAEAQCPFWRQHLNRMFDDNQEKIHFLQVFLGSCLLGVQPEPCVVLAWGGGANGKGSMIDGLYAVLGPYAREMNADLILHRRSINKGANVAFLKGVRLTVAQETGKGDELNTEFVKHLTGGDVLVGEEKYKAPCEFRPQCKIIIATNNRPYIADGASESVRRRIVYLPCTNTIPVDQRLPKHDVLRRFQIEAQGILAWQVAGAVEYVKQGRIYVPDCLREETDRMLIGTDYMAHFLRDCVSKCPGGHVSLRFLYDTFKVWCRDKGEGPSELSFQGFNRRLAERGFTKDRKSSSDRTWGWQDIKLSDEGEVYSGQARFDPLNPLTSISLGDKIG